MPDGSKSDGSTHHNLIDASLSQHNADASPLDTTLYDLAFNQQGAHFDCSESHVASTLPPDTKDDVLADQPTTSPPETSIDAVTKEHKSQQSKAATTTEFCTLPGYTRAWEHHAITQDDYEGIENRPNLRVVANAARHGQLLLEGSQGISLTADNLQELERRYTRNPRVRVKRGPNSKPQNIQGRVSGWKRRKMSSSNGHEKNVPDSDGGINGDHASIKSDVNISPNSR